MFMSLERLKVLVVGGGNIAAEKLDKLVDFTKDITVISKEVSEETDRLVRDHSLTLYMRAYKAGDIDGFDIVIVATDTVELHKAIYEESRGRRILVNSVDNTAMKYLRKELPKGKARMEKFDRMVETYFEENFKKD